MAHRTRGPRAVRDEPPLDRDQIVAAAVRLTRRAGLDHWSLRQLAEELGCWPTAISHHAGDRAALTQAVVDHVVGLIGEIDDALPWRAWFATLLADLRTVLRRHPGVARWLALSGPVVPSALRIIDRGVRKLAREGLGEEAPDAYAVLLNTSLLLIAIEDDRQALPQLRRQVRSVLRRYADDPAHPGLAAMAEAVPDRLSPDRLYRYSVERALDGIEARITAVVPVCPQWPR